MRNAPLWSYCEVNPISEGFKTLPEGKVVTFVPLEAVWPSGRADFSRTREWNRKGTYSQFMRGDILVPKITPTFEAGRACVAEIPRELGLASTEVHVLRPNASTDPRWLCYWMQTTHFLDFGAHNLQGVGNLRRISAQFLESFPLVECPLPTQRAIADYLDRETAEIDAMAAELEELVTRLEERRSTAINEAVTGLSIGRAGGVGMSLKATSSYWLPEVPDGWQMVPAWILFTEGTEKCDPTDVHLTPSRIYGVIPQEEYSRRAGHRVVANDQTAANMKKVMPNDFIISMGSYESGIEHSKIAGKVSNDYRVLRPTSLVSPGYYRWFLKSKPLIDGLMGLTTEIRVGQRIHYSRFALLELPLPPLLDQRAIADYLDEATAEIDSMIADARELKALLAERRSALITEVVTGRKEVPV